MASNVITDAINQKQELVNSLRKSFNTHKTKSIEWRKEQLNALSKMIDENVDLFCDALKKDLNKHAQETIVYELEMVKKNIAYSLHHLNEYTKLQSAPVDATLRALYSGSIQYQPYGVVLNIGAWNYPFQLCLVPLVGIIASGNCALIKPSELSENSAKLIEQLVNKYMDNDCIKVMNGGVQETVDLLKQRFDFIMYTGSTAIGKSIMQAAAKYMTPVLLECGGKSPVYVDQSADLHLAAKRIAWGKFSNAGQTCVAPDYVLCTKEVQDKLVEYLKESLLEFYGENPENSESYARMINERHFKRVSNLIDQSKVVHGGQSNEKTLHIAPTIMTNVTDDDNIMKEEIFGPVLPIMTVENHKTAIEYINSHEKPLTLYVFSKKDNITDDFINFTSSGAFSLNDVLIHVSQDSLPFGGVGESGIGSYHAKYSFESFSHRRAILKGGFFGDSIAGFRYPPYSEKKISQFQFLVNGPLSKCSIL